MPLATRFLYEVLARLTASKGGSFLIGSIELPLRGKVVWNLVLQRLFLAKELRNLTHSVVPYLPKHRFLRKGNFKFAQLQLWTLELWMSVFR